jgi:hypothetical protein
MERRTPAPEVMARGKVTTIPAAAAAGTEARAARVAGLAPAAMLRRPALLVRLTAIRT